MKIMDLSSSCISVSHSHFVPRLHTKLERIYNIYGGGSNFINWPIGLRVTALPTHVIMGYGYFSHKEGKYLL